MVFNTDSLRFREARLYSQNGEDGITLALCEVIQPVPKFFVEFGTEAGTECNMRIMREKFGWSGLQMDGAHENEFIKKEYLTKDNIVSIFEKYEVPKEFGILSVDIDGNDWYLLREIFKAGYSFDILIVEYNASLGPVEDQVIIYDESFAWDGTLYYGASLKALENLGNSFGYTLVYCESKGVNAFFVNNKHINLFEIGNKGAIFRPPYYGPHYGGHRPDPTDRKFIKSPQ